MLGNVLRTVIDSEGFYVTRVMLGEDGVPYAYDLQPRETLIDFPTSSDCIKPRWTGEGWEETATAEEIAEIRPEPPPYFPTLEERQAALEQAIIELAGEIYG